MKIEAKLEKIYYDFAQKGTKFQFFCYGNETANLEKYLGKKVNLELKGDKRSLGANRIPVVIAWRTTREVKSA